jgi:hypothetical protein
VASLRIESYSSREEFERVGCLRCFAKRCALDLAWKREVKRLKRLKRRHPTKFALGRSIRIMCVKDEIWGGYSIATSSVRASLFKCGNLVLSDPKLTNLAGVRHETMSLVTMILSQI